MKVLKGVVDGKQVFCPKCTGRITSKVMDYGVVKGRDDRFYFRMSCNKCKVLVEVHTNIAMNERYAPTDLTEEEVILKSEKQEEEEDSQDEQA